MCDYSLHSVRNRLAVEGEQLVVHRFATGSIGLAPSNQLQRSVPACRTSVSGLWSALKSWFQNCFEESPPAVCVAPGARLMLRDIPESLQREFGVGPEEEVTFTELTASEYSYRDAVRFKNNKEVLLQMLEPGQRVDVLSLSCAEPSPFLLGVRSGV
jgi:hypothetical protein